MRRETAFKILKSVMIDDQHAHLELKKLDLKEEDQAFVSALVYTTLQNYLFLDYQIDNLVSKDTKKEVRLLLIMALAQYFLMNPIPDYALVNEHVELAKKTSLHRYSGLINKVLKKVIDRGLRAVPGDELDALSINTSMPKWILSLLKSQYSFEFAKNYAEYCQQEKPSYVRLNPRRSIDELEKYVEDYNDALVAKSKLFQSQHLNDGDLLIQDINSQKVVDYLMLEKGMEVLDCCCGPGTKTTQIADRLENTGHIDGIELHESRSIETRKLLEKWGITNTEVIASDVLDYETDKRYDRILIDAPCSGLGVLSHKHDLRYHIKPEDLDDLQKIQGAMLDHTASLLKVKGVLVYATCTLNKKENEKQIEKFLDKHENFRLIKEVTLDPVTTLGDGFYIAQCQRTW